ncbi:unnamed protein product, partial [Discosporangium mesarthrocarpum]
MLGVRGEAALGQGCLTPGVSPSSASAPLAVAPGPSTGPVEPTAGFRAPDPGPSLTTGSGAAAEASVGHGAQADAGAKAGAGTGATSRLGTCAGGAEVGKSSGATDGGAGVGLPSQVPPSIVQGSGQGPGGPVNGGVSIEDGAEGMAILSNLLDALESRFFLQRTPSVERPQGTDSEVAEGSVTVEG